MTIQENMLLFVGTETTESKPVKLETSYTVIVQSIVSVLWTGLSLVSDGNVRNLAKAQ